MLHHIIWLCRTVAVCRVALGQLSCYISATEDHLFLHFTDALIIFIIITIILYTANKKIKWLFNLSICTKSL